MLGVLGSVTGGKMTMKRYFFFFLLLLSSSLMMGQAPEGVEAVDLGLPSGTLWANMNVGASSASDCGDYFSWGEVEPKDVYNLDTYKWYGSWTVNDSTWYDEDGFEHKIPGGTYHGYTKYTGYFTEDSYMNECDYKKILDLEDDAAYVNWGGNWRMPTLAQLLELKYQCTWEWGALNGVEGYKVVGPSGNYIFIPVSGIRYDNRITRSQGVYWSNEIDNYNKKINGYAQFLEITDEGVGGSNGTMFIGNYYILDDGYRPRGCSVRPVQKSKYKLTYIVDEEVYYETDVKVNEVIEPITLPSKTGYSFSGWEGLPETMPAHDVTVTGTFTVNQYELTYEVDGEKYKTIQLDYGSNVAHEPAPVKEGYIFWGWYGEPSTMPAFDVTVTGFFEVRQYILKYMIDGEVYRMYPIIYGATITPEDPPAKEGFSFSGWSEIPETMPAHDVTVTGTFVVNQYSLTYIVDEVVYKSLTLDYGTKITPEPAAVKEGYTFSGWSDIPEIMPAHDVVVNGTFTINKYRLIYMVDGKEYKSHDVVYNAVITQEPAPVKEGYTFSGWSGVPERMPAHDVTVTGTFAVNQYLLLYILDGKEYKTLEIDYGTMITPEPNPEQEGYTFSGWSDIPPTMPAHTVIITGTFTINSYKLTYLLNGEDYKQQTITYGTPITPEPAIEREGHTFSGWSEIPTTMPAHDVTVTGTLTVNRYILTYILDGLEYKTFEVNFGTSIIPEPAPEKEGYTFSGWIGLPETMPARFVIVTGTFSINSYTLTYMIDDEVYKQVKYEYGAAVTPEPMPEGDYKSFEWVGVPATMPSHDVTVNAVYETGIAEILLMVEQGQARVYAPNGKLLNRPQKGLNIIVFADGKVRKVVVK